MVAPISDDQFDYARKVNAELACHGIRSELDARSETLNKRVREARLRKIPYICVVGKREVENDTVTVTNRDTKTQVTLTLNDLIQAAHHENNSRSKTLGLGTDNWAEDGPVSIRK